MKKKKIKKLIEDTVKEIKSFEKELYAVTESYQDISEIDPESSEKFEQFVRKIVYHEDCFINFGQTEIAITIQLKNSNLDISIIRDSGFNIIENKSGHYGPLVSRYHDTKLYGRIEQEIRKIKSEKDSSRLESTIEELYNKTGLLRGENLNKILDEEN